MTAFDLAAIRERANNATKGPWHTWDRGIGHEVHRAETCVSHLPERWCPPVNDGHRETFSEADAVFIAHAREDVPALLDHVDTLTARLAAVRELVAEFEAEDIMPVGQVTLIRAAINGD